MKRGSLQTEQEPALAITQVPNVRRGQGPELLGKLNGTKTHCVNNHEFTEANTRYRPAGGRACRQCERDRRLVAD
jgi:hypothetical protein